MKDGRTHLAHKAEHAVDVETGAIVAVTLQGADTGDTTTIVETATAAADQIEDAQADVDEPQALEEIIADKGYHSNQTMVDLDAVGLRSYIAEPVRGDNEICRTCCLMRECYRTASFDSYRPRRSFLCSACSHSGAIRAQKHRWSCPDSLRAGGLDGAPREGAQRPNVGWRARSLEDDRSGCLRNGDRLVGRPVGPPGFVTPTSHRRVAERFDATLMVGPPRRRVMATVGKGFRKHQPTGGEPSPFLDSSLQRSYLTGGKATRTLST